MLCFCPGDGMTVYLDGVWFLNGFVDYLLLTVTGNLTASGRGQKRILLAGVLGGVYGVVCLLPGWGFLGNLLWRMVASLLLCAVAFGPGRFLLRQTAVLWLLTAAFGGIVMMLTEVFSAPGAMLGGHVYYPIGMQTLILTAGGTYGLLSWGLGRFSHQGGDLAKVKVSISGKNLSFSALRDTGNTLRDPISGTPVMVADLGLLREVLPEIKSRDPETLMTEIREKYPRLRPRLIPYKAVGVPHGMLLGLKPQEVRINGKNESLMIAFSPVAVSDGGGYRALLGGELR